MPVKIFQGQPETVEKAMNTWEQLGGQRHIGAVVPMPTTDGDVAVLIFYQDTAPAAAPVSPNGRPQQIQIPR